MSRCGPLQPPSAPVAERVLARTSPTLERVRQFFKPSKTQLRRVELNFESLKRRLELARAGVHNEPEASATASLCRR